MEPSSVRHILEQTKSASSGSKSECSGNIKTMNELQENYDNMKRTITNLSNDSKEITKKQWNAKQIIQQLQQQNKSLQYHQKNQSDAINQLNVDLKLLKKAVNSLEDEQELNHAMQQKSKVISSLNGRQQITTDSTTTTTTSEMTTTNTNSTTNTFTLAPTWLKTPTNNQQQVSILWTEHVEKI